jgi:hypothetical protein
MELKEFAELAESKGFKPMTFSTRWTHEFYLGMPKRFLVNESCYVCYLAEIQYWLRVLHNIHIIVLNSLFYNSYKKDTPYGYSAEVEYMHPLGFGSIGIDKEPDGYESYEGALEKALSKALTLIK